jgi:hypothetical protein
MRIFVGKAYMGVTGRGRSLDIGAGQISRKKTVWRTKISHTSIVQQHHHENFVEIGFQGIVQRDPLSR